MNQFGFTISENDLVSNPEHRLPSILLIDISMSMAGEPIRQLQEGIEFYHDSLVADNLARKRVEVAIIAFGGSVETIQAFATADNFASPTLTARGDTPMGEAIVTALRILGERKQDYRDAGIQYYRPWVFLITDGGPTDLNTKYWSEAKEIIKQGESAKGFSFFSVGVKDANMERLAELNPARQPLKLDGLEFKKMFEWLSSSQQSVSKSNPGDSIQLENPTEGPNGWATL